MSMDYIRDRHFHVIGGIRSDGGGKQTAFDAHFHMVGIYDPKMDLTRDAHFQAVGSGNQLVALIWRAHG
jgi:hypothetical protein